MVSSLTPAKMEELAELVAERVASKLTDQRQLVGREELAVIIGLSVPTIDRWTKAGKFPRIPRDSSGDRVLYDPTDVIAAMKKGGEA